MAQITSISFGRTFNIGNYESVRFEVAVQVDATTDVHAAAAVAREAVDAEFAAWKATHVVEQPAAPASEPEPPASPKQRAFLDRIVGELGWSTERIADFAATSFQAELPTLTKDQASRIIDQLIAIRDGKAQAPLTPLEQAVAETADEGEPARDDVERATARQIAVLERLHKERDIGAGPERPFAELSLDEAGELIAAWQQRPRRPRPALDEELPF